jgi:hypothetical protein
LFAAFASEAARERIAEVGVGTFGLARSIDGDPSGCVRDVANQWFCTRS